MIHPATCLTLLSLVALRGLVPIPHLLHLLVLHRSARSVPLRTGISIMPNLSTFKAIVARGGVRCTGPHRRANWSHRTALWICRARSLRPWALELLSGVLKLLVLLWLILVLLLLAISPCRASWTERSFQWGSKAGRMLLPDCPGVVAFLFSSPSSLRMDSKQMALSSRCWKDEKV
jgi:hypothetical protein